MTVKVPYDGFLQYELDRVHRPRSLKELSAELWDSDSIPEPVDQVATKTPAKESVSKVVKSRIRVLLSRPLTWAEREDITTDFADPHYRRLDGQSELDGLKLWVSPNGEHVWAEAPYGSRPLYDLVAITLENSYVNVFPRAVRTFREYNGE
jgi:hypothetical protein